MVTLKWTKDAQGCPVSTWAAEEPTMAEATQFGTSYHKAVRPSLKARASARRRLVRTLTTLAATAVVK
jgi:hypothetical protein